MDVGEKTPAIPQNNIAIENGGGKAEEEGGGKEKGKKKEKEEKEFHGSNSRFHARRHYFMSDPTKNYVLQLYIIIG